jgi:flagellar hook-associated protein 2
MGETAEAICMSVSSVNNLSSYFTTLISNLMSIERQSVTRLQEQKDTINLRYQTYSTFLGKLNDLQDSVKALNSQDPFYSLSLGRKVAVTPEDSNTSVLTAVAGTHSVAAQYEISVQNLAKSQRKDSAEQSSSDLALGHSGTFWLGGTGNASTSVSPNNTVTGVSTAALHEDVHELGTNTYNLVVRDNNETLEFRLKDSDGNVVAIADQDGDEGETTTAWQTVNAGDYDTGKGLVITFGESASAGTTEIEYTAAGTYITVEESDSLVDIATKINDADQPDDRNLHASVVGTRLIITAAHSGTGHTMIFNDGVGLGFDEDLQAAEDAQFSVNSIDFVRSSNENITNVIYGVTLGLASDAEGETAILDIEKDASEAMSLVKSFVEKFNDVQSYLTQNTSVTESNGTYTRGILASDSIFSDLRTRLFSTFISNVSASGSFRSLRDIGITMSDGLQATISDEEALENALLSDLDDVTSLLATVMDEFDQTLERFTASSGGYLQGSMSSYKNYLTDLTNEIDDENIRLDDRELSLISQYAKLQAELTSMSYLQEQMSALYGGTNKLY